MTSGSIDALVDTLSLEEQVALLAGANFWETVAVERAGIPSIRVSDGPVGARGTRFDGPASINVPCGTSLAATWDPSLAERIGALLGRETRAKGARVLLAPTVNLHRTPIGGRNFECMSEDPYLTAQTAVAYVTGVQSEGVASCIKHYVGNDTEFERNSIDSRIDERTLRELYLVPFEAAVKRAGVMAVMTAYNRINGPFAADSRRLLHDVLREEWGFDGLVMSDWFGLHSTAEAVHAGLDLEMPGPTIHRGAKLLAAVETGEVDPADIRRAAHAVLRLVERVGGFEDGGPGPETTRLDDDDIALVRAVGAAGMVLLRNTIGEDGEPVLPLRPDGWSQVAVIGPNAAVGQIMGGGSAHVTPTSVVHPLDALTMWFGDRGVAVASARGAVTHKRVPALDGTLCSPIRVEFFSTPAELDDPSAVPSRVTEGARSHFMWNRNPANPANPAHEFGARLTTTFTPDRSGSWTLSVASISTAALFLDGAAILDNASAPVGGSFFGMGKTDVQVLVDLEAGRAYDLRCDLRQTAYGQAMSGLLLGAFPPVSNDLIGEACALAAASDLSVLVVGTNDDWESEGWDRDFLGLPGAQDELITRVAAVSKRTVVIVNAGSPVTMPWLGEVDAVLMAWFPGQEMGASIVDLLSGAVEPEGRLPVTFPARLEDTPAFEHYPGRNGVADYRERRLIGYRWYDTVGRQPLFPFGFGLGYVPVTIDGATANGRYAVDVTLGNDSDLHGVEVVQVYLRSSGELVEDQPAQRLIGFAKVSVPPGGCTVTVDLDPDAYRTWDTARSAWTAAPGPYELTIGHHSRDAGVQLTVDG